MLEGSPLSLALPLKGRGDWRLCGSRLVSIVLAVAVLLERVPSAPACGCGLAIADPPTFTALREPQAFLVLDVKDPTTYEQAIFFSLVSSGAPSDVTIVFPMRQIPTSADGRSIENAEFLQNAGVLRASQAASQQSLHALLPGLRDVAGVLVALSAGLI